MKKLILIITILLLGISPLLKAQCYGDVHIDLGAVVDSGGANAGTFFITTAFPNELILIAFDGWSDSASGPVTVDGDTATHINTAHVENSAVADVYCYSAASVGTHTIVCNETGYDSPYYLNLAAGFYVTNACTPLSCNNLITTETAVGDLDDKFDTDYITTTTPNEMIFCTAVYNTGLFPHNALNMDGVIYLDSLHVGNGIDASEGYEPAPVAGTYSVTTSDSNSQAGGEIILVAIVPPACGLTPSISSATNPACGQSNGSAVISVSGGTPPYTYLWEPGGQTTDTATGLAAGTYTYTVSDSGGGCAISNIVTILGPTPIINFTDVLCSRGNSGTATVTILNDNPPYTYLWSNGTTTQKDTGLASGKYYVTITDTSGCKLEDSVVIINATNPNISIKPASDSICSGSTLLLNASGGETYTWLPAIGLTCYNCPSPTANPTVTTIYTVTGVDSNECSNTATATIKVIPVPYPVITGKDSICKGFKDTLSVTGGMTYKWSNGATTTAIYVSPIITITVTVTAYNSICSHDTTFVINVVPALSLSIMASNDSVCSGDSVQLTGKGGVTYKWSNGATTASTWVAPLTTTIYTLYGYEASCSDSATIKINVTPATTASISARNDTVCPFGTSTLTITGSGGQVTYLWNTGATTSSINVTDTVTTTYTATVHGKCNDVSKTITVIVLPPPNLIISGAASKCKGFKDTLTVSGGTTYKWSNGSTKNNYFTGDINADSTITVIGYNSIGCSDTVHFTISIAPSPSVTITHTNGCKYSTIEIKANATGVGPFNYIWSPGGETSDSIAVSDTAQTYMVTVSNGCKTIKTVEIAPDNPILSACCDKVIFKGDDTVINASGGGIVKYQWIPATGLNCDTCPSVIASPSVTTTYTVIGTDTSGCQVENVVTIIVEEPCLNFVVPNVFTPDFAGPNQLNNLFYIKAEYMSAWSIMIYDRWGKEVFKSTNPVQYWDGNTEGGSKASDGVYYYIIKATCQGNTYNRDGFVQLIR